VKLKKRLEARERKERARLWDERRAKLEAERAS
jgi:hypothetical protein